jgi:hypothetical protein
MEPENSLPCSQEPSTGRRQKGKSRIWDSKIWSLIPTGLGSENECAGNGQQQLQMRPILSSERMLYKAYDCRCSIEKKNSGRESQGARRQDQLIGGKPPVAK